MLLVDDEESEILENDPFRQDPVGRHDAIDRPFFESREYLGRFPLGTETGQDRQTDPEIR